MRRGGLFGAALVAGLIGAGCAWAADPLVGQPVAEGINFQPAATPIMEQIESFHNFLLWVIFGVALFVLLLLLWVMIRYNRRANPTPRKFTHNMLVEVIWTIVPVLILVAIAWRSFPLLFQEEKIPPSEITIKVTGNSWFWQYEYEGMNVNVTSVLLPDAEARRQGRPRLLAVDNPIYVPTHANVRVLITSNDVIHSWSVPSFGVKADAVQGRVNDAWFNVEREGVFYGQCSQLCGIDHAFMPIEVRAVSREAFNQWVASQGGSLASAAPAPGAAPSTGAPAAPSAAPAGAAAPAHTPAR